MDFLKHFSDDAREPVMVHAGGIRACMQELLNRAMEFKIKVDKAQTVPYTVRVDKLEKETCLLVFQRPLPPELISGALFVGNFQMEGHNFQTRIKYQGREAYLRYRFGIPEQISKLERRKTTRLPFRPREKAYVTLKDGGVPGLGAAGPLLNISQDGLAMRVDRVLRLDNGLRLPISGSHFPAGKVFSNVRLEELPGLASLDLPGFAIHASDRGGILMVGLQFQEPAGDQARQLEEMLKLRAKLLAAKGPSVGGAEGANVALRKSGEAAKGPGVVEVPASWDDPALLQENPPEETGIPQDDGDPLHVLQRRVLPLLVLGPSEEASAPLAAWLRERGYRRLAFAQERPASLAPGTLVLDLREPPDSIQGQIPVGAPESWERELLGRLDPVAFTIS